MTDAGIIALGAGCDQLQSIIPKGCKTVSDADISALGAGCGLLLSIDLSCPYQMTEEGISALGAGFYVCCLCSNKDNYLSLMTITYHLYV